MAEIINLNRARKQANRQKDKARADANRAAFGRPKAERLTSQKNETARVERLDAHRLEKEID